MLKSSMFDKIIESSSDSGYRSVYSFSKQDAMEIKDSRCSKGFDQYEVGTDVVPIDLDDGARQLEEVESILNREGLGYTVWFSGGKGNHIFIPTDLMVDRDLPYSHLQFLTGLGIEADSSLYQHGRILSLPGRVHPKTKVKKYFVKEVVGHMANVEIVKKPIFTFSGGCQESTTGLAEAMMLLSNLSINEPRKEMRHTELWGVGKDLVRCGLADATIYDLLNTVMGKWDVPKDEDKLVNIVKMCRRQA